MARIAPAPPGVRSRPPPSLALVSDGTWGRKVVVSVGWVAANEFHLEGGEGVGACLQKHDLRCKLKAPFRGLGPFTFPCLLHSFLGSLHQFPSCCWG